MLPNIAIGIAVDDTIHIIWRFEKELRRHKAYGKAMVSTLQSVGKPVIITSVLICLGFGALFFSRLTIMTEFGVFLAMTVAVALIVDLFVTPGSPMGALEMGTPCKWTLLRVTFASGWCKGDQIS